MGVQVSLLQISAAEIQLVMEATRPNIILINFLFQKLKKIIMVAEKYGGIFIQDTVKRKPTVNFSVHTNVRFQEAKSFQKFMEEFEAI